MRERELRLRHLRGTIIDSLTAQSCQLVADHNRLVPRPFFYLRVRKMVRERDKDHPRTQIMQDHYDFFERGGKRKVWERDYCGPLLTDVTDRCSAGKGINDCAA